MRKRILSMVLCISMALTFMPRPVLMAQTGGRTPDNPDQSTSPGALTMQMRGGATPAGDGTLDNPYQITTVEELAWCTASDGRTAHSILMTDLTSDAPWNTGVNEYTGSFDGNGHTITLKREGVSSPYLIREVHGTVRNLHVLLDFNITAGGGICEELGDGGVVENCSVSGQITYTGNNNVRIGGICGFLNKGATIGSCYGSVKINNQGGTTLTNTGVLIGFAKAGGRIENSYLPDNMDYEMIGADSKTTISGMVKKVPQADLKSGAVTYLLNGSQSTDVVWRQTIGTTNNPSLKKTEKVVYAVTKRDCPDSAPRGIGYNNTGGNEEPVGDHDYDTPTGVCKYCGHTNPNDTPDGNGSLEEPYQISSIKKLYWFAEAVAENATFCAKLTNDIIVNTDPVSSTTENPILWTPIGTSEAPFLGTFDGGGHKISGLYCQGHDISGLFGISGGKIQNVTVENSYFSARSYIAGICGQNIEGGELQNCTNASTLSHTITSDDGWPDFRVGGVCALNRGNLSDCSNSGTISGEVKDDIEKKGSLRLGGLCGENTGQIIRAVNSGEVKVDSKNTILSNYLKTLQTGGICGYNTGDVEQSKNEGSITVNVTGNNGDHHTYAGGICGYSFGRVKTSYNTAEIKSNLTGAHSLNYAGGICGSNKSMKESGKPDVVGLIEDCYNTANGTIEGNRISLGGISGENAAKIKSSYNLAIITGEKDAGNEYCNPGSIYGVSGETAIPNERCFGLTGTSSIFDYNNPSGTGSSGFKTAEQFASGEVAYLLNGYTGGDVWRQNINPGTGDATPLLDSSLPKVYYYGEKYSNSNCSHENMDEITGFCEGCGTYNGRPENGNGTLENPYELSNSKHLYWFSALTRGQENELSNSSAHAKLTNDIVVNSKTMSEQSTDPVVWLPIGTSEAHFKGSIDGQGHTVSGLYFNDDTKSSIGLVGYGGSGVSVKDITIANTYFKGSSNIGAICGSAEREAGGITSEFTRCETLESVIVSGKGKSVGGIVGSLKGKASNCKNAAIVTSHAGAGGIAGYAIVSDIIGCENSGVINTTGMAMYEMPANPGQRTYGDFTGGIVGAFRGGKGSGINQISNCRNSGSVLPQSTDENAGNTGGIAGATSDNIEIINCYNTGEVRSLAIIVTTYSGVGGIVGSVRGDAEGRRCGSVKQCHNIGFVTGKDRVGGLVGNYSEGILAGLANSFSLEGKADKAIGTGVPTLAENVGIKTEEAFRNSSLIGFLNSSDPIWEQGLNYPIFLRTQVDVSGVSVLNKSYDTEEISYSGTPIAQLNATPITVEGYTYTWQYKGAEETYSNMEDNIAPVDVGDYRLVVSISDLDPNYGGRQEIDFTISSKVVSSPIITLENSSYPYTGTAIEPAIIVKDGEKVIPADQYTISYLNNQEVGTASIIITAKEGVNYTVTGSTNFIIKGTLEGSVVIDNMAPSYGDILTVNVSGQQSDVLYQWKAGNENIGTNASTYQVEGEDIGKQITVTITDPVYEGTLISLGTSEVTPKLVRVSGITADDKAYDGKLDAKLICNLAIITGLVTGETLTITADGKFEDANVGNKSVHISNIILLDASGSAANYVLAQSGNQAITTASITPTVIAGSFEANKLVGYMDTREQIISTNNFGINLAGEFTANGMIVDSDHVLKDVQYGENIIFTLNNGLSLNNQTASIPILFTAENGNYSPKELTLLVTLTDRQLVEITGLVPAGDLIYTGKAQSGYIGRVVVSGAEVPTDALIYTYTSADGVSYNSTTAPRDAGSYNLIVSIAGDHPNYTGNSNTINFTIDKKSLTAKADNKSMTEGEKLPKFTVSYPGIVDGDQEENIIKEQAVASCEADGKSRGSYTIIISNPVLTAEGEKNYTLDDSVTGTLDVKKKSSGGSSSGGSTSSGGGGSTTQPPVKEPDKQDPIIEDEDPDTPPDGLVPTVFSDIATHWAKKDIEFVTARGLFTGTGDKKFSPNIPMTRGMFVTVLGRLASADISSYTTSSFGDVKSDAYYMGYIQWASENSIVAGVSQNQFTPDMAITREQMAVILYRYSQYKGYDTSQGGMAIREFTDYESISDYGRQAMGWAVNNGLIQGSDRNLMPKESATRAQIAAILKRYSQL